MPEDNKMPHKSFEILETKTLEDEEGTFEALVSVFGNVDIDNERVVPGAFAKSLEQWRQSGDPIPVVFAHQWNNPMAHIGVADPHDVKETDRGLWVKGRLDIADNEVARQVYRLMKRRSLKEFSFGFPRGAKRTRAKDGVFDLSDIELAEFGPAFKGANPATELHAVKAALDVEVPEAPRDEATLRREADRVDREQTQAQLPEVTEEPGPSPDETIKALTERLEQADAELARLREKEPVKSAEQLRQETERLVRAETEKRLEELNPPSAADVIAEQSKQIEALTERLEKAESDLAAISVPPRDEKALRRESDLLSRDDQREKLGLELVDAEQVKAQTERVQQGLVALEQFEPYELAGMSEGVVKAVWTTAYINDLPDGAFLYVESGGSKDSDGKTTPRSLRHFPYKDASGNVDLPHLRNALARIPQSNLPESVKNTVIARARRILANSSKTEDSSPEPAEAPTKARTGEDDLRRRSLRTVLELQSDGVSTRKPPKATQDPQPEPPSEAELRRASRDAMFNLLTGDIHAGAE